MTTPTQDLCERLSHVEGMRRIGPLIAEARATIEAQAEHIQKQALEYISLFDQCSEVEVKCALLSQSLEQEKTRSAALEAGLTDGVTDDMAVLQSRVEELEAQLRERGEPMARVEETPVGPKLYVNDVFVHSWFGCCYDDRVKAIAASINAAHPPATYGTMDVIHDAFNSWWQERELEAVMLDFTEDKCRLAFSAGWVRAQPPAAAANEELLREIAALKRYDPNGVRGFAKSTLTVNVPKDLFERIDAGIAAQKERGE